MYMQLLKCLPLLAACLFAVVHFSTPQKTTGMELPPIPSFIILAPSKVRPNQVLQTSVTLLRMLYKQFTVRLAIKMNSTEYINAVETFTSPGTRIMQMKIPRYLVPGVYWFHVDGSVYPNGALIFSNRTQISYQAKELSIIIQTSKPIYHQSQIVRFRVIPVLPNLMPAYGSLMSVEVIDTSGILVRRWMNPMTNAGGVIELDFPLSDQVSEGFWKIRARQEKFVTEKKFRVEEYWEPRFDVNVSLPLRLNSDGFGIYGLIGANHTSGMPVKGNATILIELRDPKLDRFTTPPRFSIYRVINVFEGKSDFLISMSELQGGVQGASLANTDVWVNVTVLDWFLLMNRTGFGYTRIYSADPSIKFLGSMVRPFKSNMYFTAYIVVYQPDGARVYYTQNRRVQLKIFCQETNLVKTETGLPIPDDGIVSYTFTPDGSGCVYYKMQALYTDEAGRSISEAYQYIFKYYSQSGTYMQITTSTRNPKVNEYMVFNIQSNYPTDTIYYQIAAAGNIVYTDKLVTPSAVMSRTFSLAISRDMAPVGRLIAFFVKQDGEVVSDSLTFFCNLTRLNNVRVNINRGKDLNVDTLEVNAYAEPGSYVAFTVLHLDLFKYGGSSILQDFDIIDELSTYESPNAQPPFMHTWFYDLEYIQRVYVPSPSFGADTNTTMNTSGLNLYTDANFTKVNFYHTCNETENAARALPCFSLTGRDCFSRAERCDGTPQCFNWVDEMNCPQNLSVQAFNQRSLLDNFNRLYRHWEDGAWFWKSQFIKPDGRIDFRVNLPKMDATWVVGAFSIDREMGFSLMERPTKFSGVRRFFITVEMPEEAVWGEQIGVRVAVFNYWDYWAEAMIEVKRSSEYRIVKVAWGGIVSAYAPRVITDQAVQTLVYLEAGQTKYIHVPILPFKVGNSTITICAYTFIGSNCEQRSVRVTMNGVPNYYHTATFLDMTSSSQLYVNNYKIIVPQMFTEPEHRQHRYVPQSPKAIISVVGDVIGPALSADLPFASTQNILRLVYGSAENVFFELGYNIQLLMYLRGAGFLPSDIRDNGLNYCNMVLQRGMSYYSWTIGAFANFRDSLDRPNVLTTALSIWSMLMTRVTDWDKYIIVPDELYVQTIGYLESVQIQSGPLTGSWEPQETMDRRFLPPIDTNKFPDVTTAEAHRRVPVAAMVVIALTGTTGSPPPSGAAADSAGRVIARAANFLRSYVTQVDDLFSKIIAAYALTQSGASVQSEISSALNQIVARAMKGNQVYFANIAVPPPTWEYNPASQKIENPRREWPNDGYAVACSSFFFMMMMDSNTWPSGHQNGTNMVQWLATQRNHQSGFTSTFDSLVAMSALTKYALADRNRAHYRLSVAQKVSSLNTWSTKINIFQSNYSTASLNSIPTDSVWGEVNMNVEGTGRLLLQLDVEFNVEYVTRQKVPYNPTQDTDQLSSFQVTCVPLFAGRNYSIMFITACATWMGNQGPDPYPESGMAVIEINLPTGYVVLNDDIRNYVLSKPAPNLRYARYRPGKIHFFFDKLTTTQTCIKFRSDRFYPVANVTREHLCSVYEYYEPGRFNYSLYEVVPLYTNNICNVCGSYECPYCPDYNAAMRGVQISSLLLLLTALIALVRYYRREEGGHLYTGLVGAVTDIW